MNHTERPSNRESAGGETALEQLSDRETLRLLPFIQRMILEKKRRSEADHQTIPMDYAQWAVLCLFDRLLTFANEIEARAAQKNSASDVWTHGAGESDDA